MCPPEVGVSRVWLEYLRETLGIGVPCPRLSWQVETSLTNWQQVGYEVECTSMEGLRTRQVECIASPQSVLVDWLFAPLISREQVSLRVRVWGADGSTSAWSEPLAVEVGLLQASDWSANFISPAWEEGGSTLRRLSAGRIAVALPLPLVSALCVRAPEVGLAQISGYRGSSSTENRARPDRRPPESPAVFLPEPRYAGENRRNSVCG